MPGGIAGVDHRSSRPSATIAAPGAGCRKHTGVLSGAKRAADYQRLLGRRAGWSTPSSTLTHNVTGALHCRTAWAAGSVSSMSPIPAIGSGGRRENTRPTVLTINDLSCVQPWLSGKRLRSSGESWMGSHGLMHRALHLQRQCRGECDRTVLSGDACYSCGGTPRPRGEQRLFNSTYRGRSSLSSSPAARCPRGHGVVDAAGMSARSAAVRVRPAIGSLCLQQPRRHKAGDGGGHRC